MYSFEDKIDVINELIAKRRNFWQLKAIADIDYEDVSQIIRHHIYNKWDQLDQSRPLENWLNRIITHQIKNIIRNVYDKVAPPCRSCSFNSGDTSCGFTNSGFKCDECPLYKKWSKNKKNGYNLLLAPSLDNPDHKDIISNSYSHDFDIDNAVDRFHLAMKKVLTARLWMAYDLIYIKGLPDEIVAKEMQLRTKETNRKPGYRQILNFKNKLVKIAKEVIVEFDVEYSL